MTDGEQAAGRFCRAQYPRLVGALGLYVGDRFVAEELAQEALLRACQHWEKVSRLQSPGGWVSRVGINLATSHLRRRQAEWRANRRAATPVAVEFTASDSADVVAVRSALLTLPPRQRAALVLRHYLDLTVEDAAATMGVSPDAVRSLTKRGAAALRVQLADRVEAGSAHGLATQRGDS